MLMKALGETGNDDQHGIAKHMAVQHLSFVESLGPSGLHILHADLVKKGVLGEHRQTGKAAYHHGGDGQGDMPEVVLDAIGPAHGFPAG